MRFHGTRACYLHEGCRCEDCTTASREYKREWRAARRAKDGLAVGADYEFRPRKEPRPFHVTRADWQDQAGCADMNTNLFFDSRCYRQLRLICWRCPVRLECLEDALRYERVFPAYGFRGGLDERERRIEARRRGMSPSAEHAFGVR